LIDREKFNWHFYLIKGIAALFPLTLLWRAIRASPRRRVVNNILLANPVQKEPLFPRPLNTLSE
jgi:hypothetical protein